MPSVGLEPTCYKALVPKTNPSTDFGTKATWFANNKYS